MAQVAAHVEEDVLIRFAQKLACNEKKVRDRALNKLRKWIENRCKMETGLYIASNYNTVYPQKKKKLYT